MGDKTGIEWADSTWNPMTGCSRISEGCRNCYAEGLAARFSDPGQPYEGIAERTARGPRWTGKVTRAANRIHDPLRWRRPRRIFVNSMSDLFHPSVPDAWIAEVFGVMALAPQHVFIILTKRPARMREWMMDGEAQIRRWYLDRTRSLAKGLRFPDIADVLAGHEGFLQGFENVDIAPAGDRRPLKTGWPLPNVWLGVSIEDQETADERVPILLEIPAHRRLVSAEPMIGPIDLTRLNLGIKVTKGYGPARIEWDALMGCERQYPPDTAPGCDSLKANRRGFGRYGVGAALDWVIAGGESGASARPMSPNWVRSMRDQCRDASVPFFFKQWGSWAPVEGTKRTAGRRMTCRIADEGTVTMLGAGGGQHQLEHCGGSIMVRTGKAAAGRLLDGEILGDLPHSRSCAAAMRSDRQGIGK